MALKDWNLEANEEANMDPLNPTNDPFRAFIINSLFVEDTRVQDETRLVLNLYKNGENRN